MTMENNRWLVPDGIEDVLPREAEQVEHWRRLLIDEFHRWGYELVMPPLVEFVQALLTGKAADLDLDTCQLVDQESGRMMGVRADMTPQVARIDAHRLKSRTPVRLCYAGEVLRARNNDVTGTRSPIQVGAELFGHAGVQSDIEVMELMLASCARLGVQEPVMTLGHVGVFRALMALSGMQPDAAQSALDVLQRKSLPEWSGWIEAQGESVPARARQAWQALPGLCGAPAEVFARCEQVLSGISLQLDAALARLKSVVQHLNLTHPQLSLHVDLTDLRGFQYHTGVVFALVDAERRRQLASGGRYDDIGAAFGRARPATGFSLDLRQLLDLALPATPARHKRVLAPAVADLSLVQRIGQLRQEGHTVVIGFPDLDWASQRAQCDGELVNDSGRWVLR